MGKRLAIAMLLVTLVGALLPFAPLRAQDAQVIAAGESVNGEVTNRFGEAWTFQGCVGDVITLTASSTAFTPFLALSNSAGETLVEATGARATRRAEIVDFVLPSSDVFTILVAGSGILARGAYDLALTSSAGGSTSTFDIPLVVAGEEVTGAVTNRFGTELLFLACANDQVTLTLTSEDFSPRLDLFGPTGRTPLLRDAATGAAQLQLDSFTLPESGLYTLIVAGASTSDRGEFALTLDLVAGPPVIPTPTPTLTPPATATPLPTATLPPPPSPTPLPPTATPTPPSALLPQGIPIQVNGGDGDLMGEIFMNPSYVVSAFEEGDTIVVGDRFYLELFVFDIRAGFYNGAGIDRVEFTFRCPNEEFYERVEQSPRYCSFSDDGGSCYVLQLQSGGFIPGSNCRIENDYYEVNITAFPVNQSLTPGNWNFYLRPEIP